MEQKAAQSTQVWRVSLGAEIGADRVDVPAFQRRKCHQAGQLVHVISWIVTVQIALHLIPWSMRDVSCREFSFVTSFSPSSGTLDRARHPGDGRSLLGRQWRHSRFWKILGAIEKLLSGLQNWSPGKPLQVSAVGPESLEPSQSKQVRRYRL